MIVLEREGLVDASGRRRRRRSHGAAAAGRDEGVPRRRLHRPRAIGRAGRRHRVPGQRHRARFPAFVKAGLSTVDSIDTSAGRLGLVLAPAGAPSRAATASGRRPRTASCRRCPSRRRAGVSGAPHRPRRRARRGGADRGRRSRRSARSSPTRRSSSPTTARATGRPRRPRQAGARVIRLAAPWQGPGADARREGSSSPGRSCSATPISAATCVRSRPTGADLAIAVFRTRVGGGFGLAKRAARVSDRSCAAAARCASRSRASAA